MTVLAFRTQKQSTVLGKDQPLKRLILPSSNRVLNLHESSQRALVNQFLCPARGINSLLCFWNQQSRLVPASSRNCNCIGILLKKCVIGTVAPLAFDLYLEVILEYTNWIPFEGTKDVLQEQTQCFATASEHLILGSWLGLVLNKGSELLLLWNQVFCFLLQICLSLHYITGGYCFSLCIAINRSSYSFSIV